MLALELVTDRATKQPATVVTAAVIRYAYEHGLILVRAGMHENVIRFIAPLVIGDAELDEGLDVLEAALAHAASIREEPVP
jgi:4-aminobutyrate aminotransferase-like enzyme